ncbi:MAG: DegT/DnrJ/EryC1/StrS family aminotransferase [Coriobacteriia bacterium]|nr:DegT/DnrJ/EryC1/StrS family aminotransferase [Coriobacteriia bacterium]
MAVPLLDLTLQYHAHKDEFDGVISGIFERSSFIGGAPVKQLEADIAAFCGTEYCVACGNGTDALFLIMFAAGIGKGDEVITTPWTFFATVEAIQHVGATPVFVDIEPGTFNIDASKIEAAITPKTKAILPVHIFGQCADMDVINAIAKAHGLLVFEDACQAIGATYKGKRAGSLAHAAAFSFFPSKNLGCAGDGGCVTTDDKELADKARLFAAHGASSKYHHSIFGGNSRLDTLQAALLSAKLPYLDENNSQRHDAAKYYDAAFADVDEIETPVERDYGTMVYHLYIIKSQKCAEVQAALKDAGIGNAIYYPLSLHLQEAMKLLPDWKTPSLPISESCDNRCLGIPCFPGITQEQQDEVIRVILGIL